MADVQTVNGQVRIGGTVRDAHHIRIDREIATTLPAQVAGGGGIVKATATCELAEPEDVVTTRRGPWSRAAGWPPAQREPATIDLTVDGGTWRRYTGMVDQVGGGVTDAVTVTLTDATERLRTATVSHDPLLAVMPPIQAGEVDRRVGLRAEYIVNVALRRAGFYNTPAMRGFSPVSVPCQGSLWPESGSLVTTSAAMPTVVRAPWGMAMGNTLATYSAPAGGSIRGQALAVCMMVAPGHASGARVDAILVGLTMSVRVTAYRSVEVEIDGTVVTSTLPPEAWTRVEVLHTGTQIEVRTDAGHLHTYPHTLSSAQLDGAFSQVVIQATESSQLAGILVTLVPTTLRGFYTTAPLNATLRTGSVLARGLDVIPALTSRNVMDLLAEISDATVCSLWIDHDGHLWWVHPDALRDQAPAAELTATADLLDLAWADTATQARREVTVTYQDPEVTRHRDYTVTVWDSGGESIDQGQEVQDILTPGPNEAWVMVDANVLQYIIWGPFSGDYSPTQSQIRLFKRGIGTWVGGVPYDQDGTQAATRILSAPGEEYEFNGRDPRGTSIPAMVPRQLTKIGPEAWRFTRGVAEITDKTWAGIQERMPEIDGLNLNSAQHGMRMPVVRAKAKVEWVEQAYTSTITGPTHLDQVTHDAGPWVHRAAVPALADWIAHQVTTPRPVLRSLPVVYRPDLWVGQVIDVTEDVIYGARLRCLIVGTSEDHTEASSDLTLTCRVLTAAGIRTTYDELAAAGGTYDELAAQGGTYDDLSGA